MEKTEMNKGQDDNNLLRNYETEFNEITSLKYKEPVKIEFYTQ